MQCRQAYRLCSDGCGVLREFIVDAFDVAAVVGEENADVLGDFEAFPGGAEWLPGSCAGEVAPYGADVDAECVGRQGDVSGGECALFGEL